MYALRLREHERGFLVRGGRGGQPLQTGTVGRRFVMNAQFFDLIRHMDHQRPATDGILCRKREGGRLPSPIIAKYLDAMNFEPIGV
ncbi:MAG: hypothetical protein D6694_00145 [Gammaproteobacteria bacterium]|nr:MAG: hypothetical protein D6694_00145 [Gammaproteobacteria bacterium]